MKRAVVLIAARLMVAWLGVLIAQVPGPPKMYNAVWTHVGGADSFDILVDGVVVASAPSTACTGTAPNLACTYPFQMTTNVPHTLTVRAVNIFGDATSLPFTAAPPAAPAAVGVK
jgi:hypothetical protein